MSQTPFVLSVFATTSAIAASTETAGAMYSGAEESGAAGTASATGSTTGATGSSTTGLFSTSSVIVIFLIGCFDLMII